MSDLGAAKGRIVIDTSDVSRAANEVKRSSEQMNKALSFIGVGVGIEGVKRLGEMAFELASDAAQAQETRASFDALAASVGKNAEQMLTAMRAASHGMISDANLVLDANRAMLLGVADSGEKLGKLLDVARVRGQAMGISISDAFETLVTGLGRMSPRMLQQIGITGGQEALDAYAASVGTTASKLTDAQQKVVLFNAVMASTQPLLDAAAGSSDSAADKFEQFGTKVANTKQHLGDFLLAAGATDALDTFSTAIDDSITQMQAMDKLLGELKTLFDGFGESTGLSGYLAEVNRELDLLADSVGHLGWMIGQGSQIAFGTKMGFRADDPLATNTTTSGPKTPASASRASGSSGSEPVPASVFDPKPLIAAQLDYTKQLADITKNSNRDIQQATEDAGRQRAETVRSYELGIVREEEDFARSRARQQRDYEQSIVQIMRDAQAREVKVRADLDEHIAQERADSNKQLARQEEDFQTARKRALKDHSDNLLDAAGNLDAKRVYEEQRNFAKQEQAAQEDHDKQLKRDAEDRSERETQERKSAEKQLDEARAADAQRLVDMKAALDLQRADEDADRELRKTRAAEDQQHALDQQAEEQGRRIQQIIDNAAEERKTQQDAFNAQLIALGLHNIAYENEQKRAQAQALKDLAPFMEGWFRTTREALEASLLNPEGKRPGTTPTMIPTFASGGYVAQDMIARVHKGEYVMPRSAVASTGGSSGRSISMGDIHISVAGTNASAGDIGRAVREEMTRVFEEAA